MWSTRSARAVEDALTAFIGCSILPLAATPLSLWRFGAGLVIVGSPLARPMGPFVSALLLAVAHLLAIYLTWRMSRLLGEPRWLTLVWCSLSVAWLPLYLIPVCVLSAKAALLEEDMVDEEVERTEREEVERMNRALSGFLAGEPTPEQLQAWMATHGYQPVEGHGVAGEFRYVFAKPGLGRLLEIGRGADGRVVTGAQIGPTRFTMPNRIRQAESHDARGLDLRDRGELHAAMGEFRRASELCPEAPQPHMNLGTVLIRLGMHKEAAAEFSEAARLDPAWAEAWGNLGAALHDLGRLAEAEVELRRAVAIDPLYAKAYLNLGVVLGKLGRYQEAMEVLQRATQLDPTDLKARTYLRELRAALRRG